MAKNGMAEHVRSQVVDLAERVGWDVQLKDNGADRYVKVLMFVSRGNGETIYIRKQGVPLDTEGNPRFFRVAVHPEAGRPECLDEARGIVQARNRRTGDVLFASSNYQAFPVGEGVDEPAGLCYDAHSLQALDQLLRCLAGREAPAVAPGRVEVRPEAVPASQPEPALADRQPERRATERVEARAAPSPVAGGVLTSGLVIDTPHIDRILAGEKVWEMRSSRTATRGLIALIRKGSGQVVGVARLVDVLGPLSLDERLAAIGRHRIEEDRLRSGEVDKWNHAWVLEGARRLDDPVSYEHPSGAVIWVRLTPSVVERVCAQIDDCQATATSSPFLGNVNFRFASDGAGNTASD